MGKAGSLGLLSCLKFGLAVDDRIDGRFQGLSLKTDSVLFLLVSLLSLFEESSVCYLHIFV